MSARDGTIHPSEHYYMLAEYVLQIINDTLMHLVKTKIECVLNNLTG